MPRLHRLGATNVFARVVDCGLEEVVAGPGLTVDNAVWLRSCVGGQRRAGRNAAGNSVDGAEKPVAGELSRPSPAVCCLLGRPQARG